MKYYQTLRNVKFTTLEVKKGSGTTSSAQANSKAKAKINSKI